MAVVYHWKHGWIPLDHTAALSKAKGNHEAAKRMLADAPSAKGITSRQHVAKAALDLPNLTRAEDRTAAAHELQGAAQTHNATDLLPSARASEEFRLFSARHAAARERPVPSAGDYTDAMEKWKREHPGQKIAGHEAEVNHIAADLAYFKRLHGGERGKNTAAQDAAERERKLRATHSSQFKALGLDKPKIVELADLPKRPRTAAELEAAARRRRARKD